MVAKIGQESPLPPSLETITQAVRQECSLRREIAVAYLMGSYAAGTATALSDVDVGIGVYPHLCRGPCDASSLAADLEYVLAEALFPDLESDPWSEWIFDPVEVVVLNRRSVLPALPWLLGPAFPVYAPDESFRRALEDLAFSRGRPTAAEARRAAWRLKASRVVRAAQRKAFVPYESLLRTCLNLAHPAVVELNLPLPARREDLPGALAAAGVVSPRTAAFIQEATALLSRESGRLEFFAYLQRHLGLLAEFALDVEMALESKAGSAGDR
ncbi:MAG: nucleotidyltransferase domain-containing protein [Clostridia bacterium]|nr:MAG: nucleotidyltransferase domain-containing protein [Clostridia bacterium]